MVSALPVLSEQHVFFAQWFRYDILNALSELCRIAKKCEYITGRSYNLLKSQWRMVSVLNFCAVINFPACSIH
jgi:hypothetical protein